MGKEKDKIMRPYYLKKDTLFISNFALTPSDAFSIPKNNGNIEIINNTLYFVNPEGLLFKHTNCKTELVEEANFIKNIKKLENSLNNLLVIYEDTENTKLFFLEDESLFKIPLNSLFSVSKNSTDIIYLKNGGFHFYRNFKRTFLNKSIKFLWSFDCIVDICINKYYLLIGYNISQKIMKASIMQIKNKALDSEKLEDEDIILYHFNKPIEQINLFDEVIIVKFKDKSLKLFKNGLKIDIKNFLKSLFKTKKFEAPGKELLKLLRFLNIEKEYNEEINKEEDFTDCFLSDKLYLKTNKGKYFSVENELSLNFLDFNLRRGIIRKIDNYELIIENGRLFINGFLFPEPFFISFEFILFNLEDEFMCINLLHNSISIKSFKNIKIDNKLIPIEMLIKMSLIKNNIENYIKSIKMPIIDFSIIDNTTYIFTETYLYIFVDTELKGFFELKIKESQYFFSEHLYLYFEKNKKIMRINKDTFVEFPSKYKVTNIVYKPKHPGFNFYNKKVCLENKRINIFHQLNYDLFERGKALKGAEKDTDELRKLAKKYKEKAGNILKKFQ